MYSWTIYLRFGMKRLVHAIRALIVKYGMRGGTNGFSYTNLINNKHFTLTADTTWNGFEIGFWVGQGPTIGSFKKAYRIIVLDWKYKKPIEVYH